VLYRNRRAKVNVKVLIILIVVPVALGTSLFAARQIQRDSLSKASLAAGEAAFEREDWPVVRKSFHAYLGRNPDDVEILKKYAQACLAIRPLDAKAIGGAIGAYRRIIELNPQDEVAYDKLAMLYVGIGNFEELSKIARTRLEYVPNDRKAPLWLADALIRLNKRQEGEQVLLRFLGELEALPDKHVEYVQACARMSEIAVADGSSDAKTKALEWLKRAAGYAPESIEMLARRARFYRETPEIPGLDEKERLALARRDLEAADHHGTENPRIRLFLATEWMTHGELDRAAAELQAAESLPQETLIEHFFDLDDWTAARFLLSAELARRKGTTAEAVALADNALASLTQRRHRVQALPSAILLYVAAGKASEARRCLNEYLDLRRAQEGPAESPRRLAGLQALVAGAENKPYAVIDTLAPVVRNDTSNPELWRMLAEAYSRTDQVGRAVNALNQYRRLNPQDPHVALELARQYSRLGDWNKVFETASTAESQDPSSLAPKLLRIGAGINLAVGQRGSADTTELKKLSAELAGLRQTNPDRVDIRMLQAIIARCLEQPQEAERQLKLAIEECTDSLRVELQLAGHYVETKRMNEAIGVCEAACKRHPEVARPWLALSDLQAANGDYASARNRLQQGLDSVTDKGGKRSLSIKLALLDIIHGDRATGTNLLLEMAAQDPQEIQARLLLLGIRGIREDPVAAGRLLGELKQAEGENGLWWRLHQAAVWLSAENWRGKQQDVVSLLRFCIDASPAWPAPVLLLAEVYERLGDVKRVEDTCRQGLAGNPSAADIANRLLGLLEKQGRFPDAEKVLQQLTVSPRLASAWQVRIALGTGDLSRAIDELKLRASSDSQDADSRVQLARLVYQETRNADQALAYLKEAETIASDARLILVKASILRSEGKAAEALQVLDRYAADHNDFNAYWMRAVYLVEAGDLERAEKDYQKLTTFAPNSEAGYELLSSFYAGTNRLDQGIAAVEQGVSAYPKNLRLQRNLMVLLLRRAQTQDRERASGILAALEEQLPHDAELMTIRALQMLEQSAPQSLASAKEKLENAVGLEPTMINAHLALIGIAMRQGNYTAACDYAIRGLESNSGHPMLLLARSKAELALGYAPMAVRLAREVLQQNPNSTEALSALADGALSSGDRALWQETRSLLDAALGRDPKNERLLLFRAHILSMLGLTKTAIPEMEAYCQTKEGLRSVGTLVTLADLYRLTGDADQSKQKIEQAERLDPNSQTVTHARLLWLVAQNRFEEIRGISSKYLSAKEQDPTILLKAASILAGLEATAFKKEGLKLYEQAAALLPTSAEAHLGQASALYQTGDAEQAEKLYRQWLAQHPNDVRALNDLAWILQEHDQRYDAALELANRGLKLAPDNLDLLDTRGTILANLADRLADAKNDFVRLVELAPADTREKARALLRLGRICVQLNDLRQAKQHLQIALEIDRKMDIFTPDERSEITRIVQQAGT